MFVTKGSYPMKRTPLLAAGSIAAMLLGSTLGPALAQAPSASVLQGFNGGFSLFNPDGSLQDALEPPDTNGAVGLTQYAVFINGGYAVYNKSDGSLQGSLSDDTTFWNNAGLSNYAAQGLSDTRLLYDNTSGHWFASEITTPSYTDPNNVTTLLPNQFLVAVSKDSNILDGFKGYAIEANPAKGSNSLFADYDTLGVNSQGVYLGATMFNGAGNQAPGTDQLAISKADLINNVASPTGTLVYNSDPNSTGYTAHPVVDLDNGGTSSNIGEYFLSDYNTPAGMNELSQLNGTIGAATLTTDGGGNVTVTAHDSPVGANQPGTTTKINAGDERYGSAPIKMNGVVYSAQTVLDPVTGNDDIRLIGINAATKTAVLDQLISSATLSYYYPSVAINAAGQVVIGFSSSGLAQYASSMAVVGQLDASGASVAFGTSITLKSGLSSYRYTRWGDYSSTFIDPMDPTKFWTIQEYAEATPAGRRGNWSTYVSEIGLAAAPEPSAWASFGIGVLGLGALVARRRKSNAS